MIKFFTHLKLNFLFLIACLLFLINSSYSQTASVSPNAVVQGGIVTASWSGFSVPYILIFKFYHPAYSRLINFYLFKIFQEFFQLYQYNSGELLSSLYIGEIFFLHRKSQNFLNLF